MSSTFKKEVSDGERFEFGKNWSKFLTLLNEDRIKAAENSLLLFLEGDIKGKRFIDVGSGSGLFSLAARRLGATVFSFDYDPQSFACTRELKNRYFNNDENWKVEQASALDPEYIKSLGKFDIVYSWGVLHHTGNMWLGLENVSTLVAADGQLFIALYNDQGMVSKGWTIIKKIYNWLPGFLKIVYSTVFLVCREILVFLICLLTFRPGKYIRFWTQDRLRGMNYYYDIIDWIGGYPFEVSKPEQVFHFYRSKGFQLKNLRTCGGKLGCNEYVFQNKKN